MNAPQRAERITLSHGGGGKAMRDLIDTVFAGAFAAQTEEDQARLSAAALAEPGATLAFTTDSFVVDPIEFRGGDIGTLAVCGTVNDLAVGGARPLWLSAAFILEEGLEIAVLRRIVASMRRAAERAGIRIVTGDTKVVTRGAADKVFVTTSGVGVIPPGRGLSARAIRPGDAALVNGPLGLHGAAILGARGEMALSSDIRSDCRPLGGVMAALMEAAPGLRAARDATRGGLAAALNEMAEAAGVSVRLEEAALPLSAEVRGMCEILGLDPLYLANEGTLVAFVPEAEAEPALAALHALPEGRNAAIIGRAVDRRTVPVYMATTFGGERIVDMLVGEQLPRIC